MSDTVLIAIITVSGVIVTALCAVIGPILLAITTQAINERKEAKEAAKETVAALQKQVDALEQQVLTLKKQPRGRR